MLQRWCRFLRKETCSCQKNSTSFRWSRLKKDQLQSWDPYYWLQRAWSQTLPQSAGSAVSPCSFQNRRGVANRSTLSSSPAREPGNEARVPPVQSKGPRTGEDKLQEKKTNYIFCPIYDILSVPVLCLYNNDYVVELYLIA